MSVYTTAQLLAVNEKKFKFDPLFLRIFFRETYPFSTEKVYLSQIPGMVNMALYVSPIVSGKVIRSRGGSTSEFTPGYVKPKHEVNPLMTLRRLPDEDPQNLADPAYRRRRIILQNMKDEELAIAQVEESRPLQLCSGKYTMTGEAFEPVEVDMGRSAGNNITQAGAAAWSTRDKKPTTRPMTLKLCAQRQRCGQHYRVRSEGLGAVPFFRRGEGEAGYASRL
jgi:hypothetical protein